MARLPASTGRELWLSPSTSLPRLGISRIRQLLSQPNSQVALRRLKPEKHRIMVKAFLLALLHTVIAELQGKRRQTDGRRNRTGRTESGKQAGRSTDTVGADEHRQTGRQADRQTRRRADTQTHKRTTLKRAGMETCEWRET